MFTYNINSYLFNSNKAEPCYFSIYSFPFHLYCRRFSITLSLIAICFAPYSAHVTLLQLFLQFPCFCLHFFIRVMAYTVIQYRLYSVHCTVYSCTMSFAIYITTFTAFLLGHSKCFLLLVCGFSFFYLLYYVLLFIQIHT